MDFMSPEELAMALKLQEQFDKGTGSTTSTAGTAAGSNFSTDKCNPSPMPGSSASNFDPDEVYNEDALYDADRSSWTLVDPRWEIIDPLPDIRALFVQFNYKYFWGKLAAIEVKWSPRMTLCAGLCVYQGKGGLCSVRLSEPLLKLRPRKDLIETLLHEMIHAYLFVTDNNKDHDGHGPEFHKHMYRLNEKTGTNISVYHTFHDEVDNYRQHWWKCDGSCQNKPPYYGMVKRAMNRAPSPRDPWWSDHQRSCGGTYSKVKEPEGYKDNKKKTGKTIEEKPKGNMDIRDVFSGKGKTLGDDKHKTSNPSGSTQSGKSSGSNSSNPSDAKNRNIDKLLGTIAGSKGKNPVPPKQTNSSAESGSNPSKSDVITNYGANIHGFGKLLNSENDDETDNVREDKVEPSKAYFPGSGVSLAAQATSTTSRSSSNQGGTGPIVRRIPGIGIIETERHSKNHNNVQVEERKEKELVTKTGPTLDQYFGKSKSESDLAGSAVKSEDDKNEFSGSRTSAGASRFKNVIDYNSEESDFDNVLDDLLKPNLKKKTMIKKKRDSKEPGGIKKIPGFTSVSSLKGKTLLTEGVKKVNKPTVHNGTRPKTRDGMNRPISGTKRKFSGNDNMAADRNKRAHYITSDSETDEEEKMNLSSVLHKNSAKVKPENSSEDDDCFAANFKSSKTSTITFPDRTVSSNKDICGTTADLPKTSTIAQPANNDICGGAHFTQHTNPGPAVMTDALRDCPVCQAKIPESKINQHLDSCLMMCS